MNKILTPSPPPIPPVNNPNQNNEQEFWVEALEQDTPLKTRFSNCPVYPVSTLPLANQDHSILLTIEKETLNHFFTGIPQREA